MAAGRNAPCPCGSGKKYKKCCLPASSAKKFDSYADLRMTEGLLAPRILQFARTRFGEGVVQEASQDFHFHREDLVGDEADDQVFIPWFLYDWVPGAGTTAANAIQPENRSLAAAFLASQNASLSEAERGFISEVSTAPFSFYDVVGADPGVRLRLRDIFREIEFEVTEHSASRSLQPGDVLYGRVVAIGGTALMLGCGSVIIPPSWKGILLQFRREMKAKSDPVTAETLRGCGNRLREIYLETRMHLFDQNLPTLQNTDGDPLLFHTLVYRIESADAAFPRLKSLAAGRREKDLLSSARYYSDGRLRRVELPWLKLGNKMQPGWENTILGHMTIDKNRMTVEVNSEKRSRKIQAEIKKRLGSAAALLETGTKSVEAALEESRKKSKTPAGHRRQEQDDALQRRPEVQAAMQQVSDAHWESWVHQPVPALGGKTPMEAVRDPDGREMVEALLTEFERSDRKEKSWQPRIDFTSLRNRLGLAKPPGRA